MIKNILKKILPINTYLSLVDAKNKIILSKSYAHQLNETKKQIAFYSMFINKGNLVFDIGANYGGRTEIFLAIGAKVVAAEPNDKCIDYLEKRFGNKINIIPKGIGKEEGVLNYFVSNHEALSTFSADWLEKIKDGRFKEHQWNEQQQKPITTLNKLIEEFGNPSFIKIDVEGYEWEVLNGLSHPINLSFEYAVPERLDRIIDNINYLNKLGNCVFNYSVGETMQFALQDWMNEEDFIRHTQQTSFINSFAGDVYVKYH